ncbi:MAG: methyltransferase domain-containing protein [Candidatus Melainabacteria bacterium]
MAFSLKQFKKSRKRQKFLKQLVAVYASQWCKTRGALRGGEEYLRGQREIFSGRRFQEDVTAIARQSLTVLNIGTMASLEAALNDAPELNAYFALLLTGQTAASVAPLRHSLGSLLSERDTGAPQSFPAQRVALVRLILDQILQDDQVVHRYDYTYLDDLRETIEGRYLTQDGLTAGERSGRMLRLLAFLCHLPTDAPPPAEALKQALTEMLGDDHGYRPTKNFSEEVYQASHYSDLEDGLGALDTFKGEEDPEKFIQVWTRAFEQINATDAYKADDHEISLVYGFENNHHLLLRTIIDLKNAGKLKPEDRILVIGPRYAHEVLFFRNILGFPNTIGLDLRDEGDVIVAGDMHDIRFPDGHFKLVFGANVFEYAYDLRRVVREVSRVLARPGYFAGIFRNTRRVAALAQRGCDVGNVTAAASLFYQTPHTILAQDEGLTPSPENVGSFPCLMVRLDAPTVSGS